MKNREEIPKNDSYDKVFVVQEDNVLVNVLVEKSGTQYILGDSKTPWEFAKSWVDANINVEVNGAKQCIDVEYIFGLGLGQNVDLLVKMYPKKQVIIVEPFVEIFYRILYIRKLDIVIEKTTIILEEPVEVFVSYFNTMFWTAKHTNHKINGMNVYVALFKELFDIHFDKFKKTYDVARVDKNTRKMSAGIWVNSYVKNLKLIERAANAHGLVDKFKGIPGILVAAGPSLAKNIHLVKMLKNKAVIIAGGSGVNSAEKFGLSPHAMLAVDTDIEEWDRIIGKIIDKEIKLIYSNQLNVVCTEQYEGKRFLMNYSSDYYTDAFFKHNNIASQMFFSAPSVVNTTFDLLYKMGCDPIIFVGQDLCFTDNRLYAGIDMPDIDGQDYEGKTYKKEVNIFGETVYTNGGMIAMRNCLENQFDRVKDKVTILNCTEGGLNIIGAKNEKLQDVLDRYNFEDKGITQTIEDIYNESCFKGILPKVYEFNLEMVKQLDDLRTKVINLDNHVNKIMLGLYDSKKDTSKYQKALKYADRTDFEIMNTAVFKLLVNNIVQSDILDIGRHFHAQNELYTDNRTRKRLYVEAMKGKNKLIMNTIEQVKGWLTE